MFVIALSNAKFLELAVDYLRLIDIRTKVSLVLWLSKVGKIGDVIDYVKILG